MTNTVAIVAAGLLCTGGLLVLIRGLIPRAVPLDAAFDAFHSERRLKFESASRGDDVFADVRRQFGPQAHRVLTRIGFDFERFSSDLRILRITDQQFAFWKLASALGSALAPPFLVAIVSAGGITFAPWWMIAGSIVGLVVGFFLPDLRVKERASDARQDFVHALSAYLGLTRSLIAAGIHDTGALAIAAQTGEGPAFSEIATAIDWANTTGRPPHEGLARLATEADLPDLGHVATTLSLASEQGATPTRAFKSAAEQITARQRFEARAEAETATTNMAVPSALLGAGYFLYLGIPVIWQILNITSPG